MSSEKCEGGPTLTGEGVMSSDGYLALRKDIDIPPFVPYLAFPLWCWSNIRNCRVTIWIALAFASLPCVAGLSDDSGNKPTLGTNILIIFISLCIFATFLPYLWEFMKPGNPPKSKQILPGPGSQQIFGNGLDSRHRSFILDTPAIVWTVLSFIGVVGSLLNSGNFCNYRGQLNPDISGLGIRISFWVSGAIVILIAGLGHLHAEETGVKSIAITLLSAQTYYGWNLVTKHSEMSAVDMLLGAMILDCLTSITSITFSMKECLAARQLIRFGVVVHVFSFVSLVVVISRLNGSQGISGVSSDQCPCLKAYWWGPVDTCHGASPTFWLYCALKAIASVHGIWLCLWHMENYDAAEKSERDDKNTIIDDIPQTVYDSIPATTFTKYREWIALSVASIINIEWTLAGFQLQSVENLGIWGQDAPFIITSISLLYLFYGMYSMFKEKNVKRRQEFLFRSSTGSLIPRLYVQRPRNWGAWLQKIPTIAFDDHPFNKLPLRATDHARMEYKNEAWTAIPNRFHQWEGESSYELGVKLIDEAKIGDLIQVRKLLAEQASIVEVDEESALVNAIKYGHTDVLKLLLMVGAGSSSKTREDDTMQIAWHLASEQLQTILDPATEYRMSCDLYNRYMQSGEPDYLEQAVKIGRESVAATPPEHPERARRLDSLSTSLGSVYKRLGDIHDLLQAIEFAEEAVAATPSDHPERVRWLSNLSIWLDIRYKQLGNLHDLSLVIEFAEEAVAAIPSGNPERVRWLDSLSMWLDTRFKLLGNLDDVSKVIKYAEEAVATVPSDHPGRARWLDILSKWLNTRYKRLGDLHDLSKTIECAEEVMALEVPNHSDQAIVPNNPSPLPTGRGELLRDTHDFTQSMLRAGKHTPSAHADRILRLDSLARLILTRHEKLGDVQDLERAVNLTEQAVAATPPNDPNRESRLLDLALRIRTRISDAPCSRDLKNALTLLHDAWNCNVLPPRIRITVAHSAALCLAAQQRWRESASLFGEAIRELSKLSPGPLERGQEHMLSGFTQLAGKTISVALQAGGEASYCLQMLELSRRIITGLTIDCRNDLSELQARHPWMFEELNHLRIEINRPLVEVGTEYNEQTYQKRRHQREQAVHEIEKTFDDIRQLPGFEGFLLTLRPEDLMAMAGEGPIVVINSTEYRSDAIIVTNSVIKAQKLPKLEYKDVNRWMQQIPQLVQSTVIETYLLWLWDAAVEPVLGELQLAGLGVNDGGNLTRIWWIGLDSLSKAPFHAAGDHSPGSIHNTTNRAISSYGWPGRIVSTQLLSADNFPATIP